MATSDLLQRLPMKDDVTFTAIGESHRRTVETFIAGGAITAGDWVAFATNKTQDAEKMIYVNRANSSSADTYLCAGVALNDAVADGRVEVCTSGIAEARVTNALGAGNSLQIGTSVGEAVVYVPAGSGKMVGHNIDAGTGATLCTVFVYKTL